MKLEDVVILSVFIFMPFPRVHCTYQTMNWRKRQYQIYQMTYSAFTDKTKQNNDNRAAHKNINGL